MSGPATPARRRVWADPRSLAATWGVAFAFFSSGYLDVSVPRVSSDGLCIQPPVGRDGCPLGSGCPIRESRDQHLVGSYPWLIAASYALHRLPAPRHPPCALSNLTTIILVSLATAGPHGRAAPDTRTLPSRVREDAVAPQRPPHTTAVDSYSPLCHYSFAKDPDIPADRRRCISPKGKMPLARSDDSARPMACQGEVRRPRRRATPGFAAKAATPRQSSFAAGAANEAWWSRWESNPRPPGCKPGALPTELRPLANFRFRISDFGLNGRRPALRRLLPLTRSPQSQVRNRGGGPRWIRTTDLALIRGAL